MDTPFDIFWTAWPRSQRKVGKAQCKAIWQRRKLDDCADAIMAGLDAHKRGLWQKDGGAFIPMPSTWLNQSRWEGDMESVSQSPQEETGFADPRALSDDELAHIAEIAALNLPQLP